MSETRASRLHRTAAAVVSAWTLVAQQTGATALGAPAWVLCGCLAAALWLTSED